MQTRFENFSNDVVGLYAGITILPTSISWDMGRDGRAIVRNRSVATATSLRSDVDVKMDSDLRRMLPTLAPPATVYFCTSQLLSEYAVVALERQLRDLCPPKVTPFVFSLRQLIELSKRWPEAFLKFYTSDYTELIATLQSGQQSGANDRDESLRLALSLFDNSDSAQMREASYRVLIFRMLQSNTPKSLRELCTAAQNLLRLGRPLPEVTLQGRLSKMIAEGVIELNDHRYSTTPTGVEEIARIDESIATQVVVGRGALRAAYERELGWNLAEAHFEQIWTELRSCLSDLFYRRGREMVQLIGTVIAADSTQLALGESESVEAEVTGEESDKSRDFFFIEELATRVAGTSSLQAQRDELTQATKDLFLTRTGEAFEWLARACSTYVMLCSLGVEESTSLPWIRALRK